MFLCVSPTAAAGCVQVRARYQKVLEEVNRYAPRYMEEMESVFDQSQDEERRRIAFLKQAFLSIHTHLDVTNNQRWAPPLTASRGRGQEKKGSF